MKHLLALAFTVLTIGCTPTPLAISTIIPCDTDTDCLRKNGNLEAVPTPSATPKPIYYCGAITKAGTPCKHRVKSVGLHCYQHQK